MRTLFWRLFASIPGVVILFFIWVGSVFRYGLDKAWNWFTMSKD